MLDHLDHDSYRSLPAGSAGWRRPTLLRTLAKCWLAAEIGGAVGDRCGHCGGAPLQGPRCGTQHSHGLLVAKRTAHTAQRFVQRRIALDMEHAFKDIGCYQNQKKNRKKNNNLLGLVL